MEKPKENPGNPDSKDFKGPFHSDVVIDDKKVTSVKTKEDSRDQKLPSSDDECGNGY